jgi:hypothetical protein
MRSGTLGTSRATFSSWTSASRRRSASPGILKPIAEVTAMSDPQAALFEGGRAAFDLSIVNANFERL